jgi:hypothetical protein
MTGDNNLSTALTRGDNIAWTEQFGNDNVSDVYQGRDLNNATISQRGDRNRAYAHQYTDGKVKPKMGIIIILILTNMEGTLIRQQIYKLATFNSYIEQDGSSNISNVMQSN